MYTNIHYLINQILHIVTVFVVYTKLRLPICFGLTASLIRFVVIIKIKFRKIPVFMIRLGNKVTGRPVMDIFLTQNETFFCSCVKTCSIRKISESQPIPFIYGLL